jgi:uncharacterized delta-60 repeat protein
MHDYGRDEWYESRQAADCCGSFIGAVRLLRPCKGACVRNPIGLWVVLCCFLLGVGFVRADRIFLDGVLDPSFGTNGVSIVSIPDRWEEARHVLPRPGGGFFAAGAAEQLDGGNNNAMIFVFTANGKIDTSAYNGGIVRSNLLDSGFALSADPNGTFLVGGGGGYNNGSFGLLRFNPNGALAGSLNPVDFGGGSDWPNALAVQGDGKVVAAGIATFGASIDHGDMAIARFTANGHIDTSFNATGKRFENFSVPNTLTNSDFAGAVAIGADGKILVGGAGGNLMKAPDGWEAGFHLIRYNSDGTRDSTFGDNGLVVSSLNIPKGFPFIKDIKLLSDGRILALGRESHSQFVMAMYHSDGSLDGGFGQGGAVVVPNYGAENVSSVIGADGSIRVVGAGTHVFDLRFDAHGDLLENALIVPPEIPGFFQSYYDAIILDDGDILAVGRAVPNTVPGGDYRRTDALLTRFDRPTIALVPEPAALGILAIACCFVPRRPSRRP